MDISFLPTRYDTNNSKEKPRSEKRCFVPAEAHAPIPHLNLLLLLQQQATTSVSCTVLSTQIQIPSFFNPHTTDIIDINTSTT